MLKSCVAIVATFRFSHTDLCSLPRRVIEKLIIQLSNYRFLFQYFIINWIFLLCLKRDELFQVITTEIDISHIAENKIGPNLHKTLSSHKSQLQLITSLLAVVATTSGYSPDNVKTVRRSPTWKESRPGSFGCVSF